MNKARRAALEKLYVKISALRAEAEEIRDEEQEAFDNMPESFQESERGEAAQNAIENLDALVSSLEEAEEFATQAGE